MIHPEFNPNIDINLCCGNCIYRLEYTYRKTVTSTPIANNIFTAPLWVQRIICLIDKEPKPITPDNLFNEEMTCPMHKLGSCIGNMLLRCPTDIEKFNNNADIKVLLNLRSDITKRFTNANLIEQHETERWKDETQYPINK